MMSMPNCSCMPMAKRTASSMRRCQRASWVPVREPDFSRSLTYCGRGRLPMTVVGKRGRGPGMLDASVNVDEFVGIQERVTEVGDCRCQRWIEEFGEWVRQQQRPAC